MPQSINFEEHYKNVTCLRSEVAAPSRDKQGRGNMMILKSVIVTGMALLAGAPALASDTEPCGKGLICASDPATVVQALQDTGYKAKLDKDTTGDPMVSSSASGYDFDIMFYGCKDHKQCDSLQMRVSFAKDGANTFQLANKWNSDKRFSQAYISDKGSFVVDYDVTTAGGLTIANFADVIDWWSVTLGNLKTFFADNPPPKS
jgi:Putative bacterial sensory transduction regulator